MLCPPMGVTLSSQKNISERWTGETTEKLRNAKDEQ